MDDASVAAAWVGAIAGLGSLALGLINLNRSRTEPRRIRQRELRAEVLRDAEVVAAEIARTEKVARDRTELEPAASALDLLRWSHDTTRTVRFDRPAVPRLVKNHYVPVRTWEVAAAKYRFAQTWWSQRQALADKHGDLDATRPELNLGLTGAAEQAREDVLAAAQRLEAACGPASEAVRAVIEGLLRLDKKPE